MPWFETHSLCRDFSLDGRTIRAIDSVSIRAERGDFVGIVGRSGSGKTTLLRIVAGLLEKSSGEILFDGVPNSDGSTPRIGMVFQEPRLMPWLTVERNILFAFLNKPEAEIPWEMGGAILEMLGLSEYKHAYPSQLSGGMAQRVALGRALCYDPELILMDEPLGSLDYFTRKTLQNEILKLYLSGGKSIFFVTHDIEEALLLSNRLIVLDSGRVQMELNINMAYPRSRTDSKFVELLERVLNVIE